MMCHHCKHGVKICRSRELRASILYTSCDCIKRNGLQDRCLRSECQGDPACLAMPEPSCCPAKHAQRYINMRINIGKPKHKCAEEFICHKPNACLSDCPKPIICPGIVCPPPNSDSCPQPLCGSCPQASSGTPCPIPICGGPPNLNCGGPPQHSCGGPPHPPQHNYGGPPQHCCSGPPQHHCGGPPQHSCGGPPQHNCGGPPQLCCGGPPQPPQHSCGGPPQPPQHSPPQPPQHSPPHPPQHNCGGSPQHKCGGFEQPKPKIGGCQRPKNNSPHTGSNLCSVRIGGGSDGDGPQYNFDKKTENKEEIQQEFEECNSYNRY